MLKVVIDCSGSMAGTSIMQARKAALEILNQLRLKDSFNVTLFGNDFKHLFPKLVPASSKSVSDAWTRLDKLDADMGGTEMEKALDAVFSLGGAEGKAAVLLITDGEIHEHIKLVKRAQNSDHRVFVVGVGTAVAEAFLNSLATATGGACELVAPQEGMAERVLSQFHRMRQPKLGQLQIEWPAVPAWQTALPETVFAGDTVHVFAGFGSSIAGAVKLVVNGGEVVATPIAAAIEANLPRIAAARRLETATKKQGLELSLSHQLLSPWTNYLVIAEREVKAGELPEIHQVPQMLAAGWGGVGQVVCRMAPTPGVLRRGSPSLASGSVNYSFGDDRTPKVSATTPAQFIADLESVMSQLPREPRLPETIDDLVSMGLENDLTEVLRKMVKDGYDEMEIIAAFIYALSESPIGHLFGRIGKRAILKGWKNAAPDALLNQLMRHELKELECDCWGYAEDIPF
jgi:Ca-activated chloride channel family protein